MTPSARRSSTRRTRTEDRVGQLAAGHEGENDKKLAILGSAIRADQPKDVRLEGIDGMGDTEDKRAIQVLQGLSDDPDEDVRQNAQDTIDQLQTDVTPPPQPVQTHGPGAGATSEIGCVGRRR